MKKSYLIIVIAAVLSLLLLSGCGEDGDGKIEMKEPRKPVSEVRETRNLLLIDINEESE